MIPVCFFISYTLYLCPCIQRGSECKPIPEDYNG
nr:MAG TPA: hypothetical protein [Caudoviricetes sp.]